MMSVQVTGNAARLTYGLGELSLRGTAPLNKPRRLWQLSLNIVWYRSCRFLETKAGALDLGHLHGRSARGYHLGEVFRQCINLLLEEEKGCTDGPQLSFVTTRVSFFIR